MAALTLADFTPDQIKRFGITQRELDEAHRRERSYLAEPVKEIDRAQWDDMLGCLPPENWHTTREGIEVFFLAEYQTGTITQQFGHFNGKRIVKHVDVADKSTWITMEDMVNASNED